MDLITLDDNLLKNIQDTIDKCLPIAGKTAQTISDSVTIANGLNQMREFFKNPELQKLIESMQDSKLGFLTDARTGRKSYKYHEITEALIPMMLEGYRFTGNEINIISGQGMPVKAGKHRKIIEYEGLEGFSHTVGSPTKDGTGETGVAKMKCQARWIIDSQEYSIGYGDDVCIIAVEFDKWSSLDKLIGLAESKLYSRVLTRILGKFVSEGEVVIVQSDDQKPAPEKTESEDMKNALKPKSSVSEEFKKQDAEKDSFPQTEPEPSTPQDAPTDKKLGKWAKKLAKLAKSPLHQIAIQMILKEGKATPESIRSEDEEAASVVVALIEKQKVVSDEPAFNWPAKLTELKNDKAYLKIINDLIVSGEVRGQDLNTMHSGTAKGLCELLERTKGFADDALNENTDTQPASEYDEFFGDE